MNGGTFKISLATPMGRKNGAISLAEEKGALVGSLRALGHENPIVNGKVNGDSFGFSGALRTGFGKIEYSAEGLIQGDVLTATAKTKYGIMKISGTRV